jgi:hypothetical protein
MFNTGTAACTGEFTAFIGRQEVVNVGPIPVGKKVYKFAVQYTKRNTYQKLCSPLHQTLNKKTCVLQQSVLFLFTVTYRYTTIVQDLVVTMLSPVDVDIQLFDIGDASKFSQGKAIIAYVSGNCIVHFFILVEIYTP